MTKAGHKDNWTRSFVSALVPLSSSRGTISCERALMIVGICMLITDTTSDPKSSGVEDLRAKVGAISHFDFHFPKPHDREGWKASGGQRLTSMRARCGGPVC